MNVAALALIAVVAWQLFRSAVVDWTTLVLAGLSFVLLIRYRVNSVWLVLGGAAIGVGTTLLHHYETRPAKNFGEKRFASPR